MTDILDTAREFVAGHDQVHQHYAITKLSPDAIYKLCRALIARTEALREVVECRQLLGKLSASMKNDDYLKSARTLELEAEFRRRDEPAWEAARRALAYQEGRG